MSFKEATDTNAGSAAVYGAPDIKKIAQYLNGVPDIATGVIDSSTTILNAKLTISSFTNVDEVICPDGPTTLVGTDTTDTLENKTLTTPIINGATIGDATDIVLDTTTGTKIGTATGQKLAFYNATPVTQRTGIADVDTSTVDGTYGAEEQAVIEDLRTKVNALIQVLEDLGITAVV